jgi:hypothetical protein
VAAARSGSGASGGLDPALSQQAQQFYMQFITRYLHESVETRCRVTTITRMCAHRQLWDLSVPFSNAQHMSSVH